MIESSLGSKSELSKINGMKSNNHNSFECSVKYGIMYNYIAAMCLFLLHGY